MRESLKLKHVLEERGVDIHDRIQPEEEEEEDDDEPYDNNSWIDYETNNKMTDQEVLAKYMVRKNIYRYFREGVTL